MRKEMKMRTGCPRMGGGEWWRNGGAGLGEAYGSLAG